MITEQEVRGLFYLIFIPVFLYFAHRNVRPDVTVFPLVFSTDVSLNL